MLGSLLHAPRGPFYSPKVARSRWRPTRKAILAFYRVAHCEDCEANRWHRRPLAHRTVRWIIAMSPLCFSRGRRVRRGWLTGQSGAPPDGSVNYSCTPPLSPESGLFTRTSLAHRTLSGVPSRAGVGCTEPSLFPILFSLFLALRQNMLVLKTMY
jgi:hypothetical protein